MVNERGAGTLCDVHCVGRCVLNIPRYSVTFLMIDIYIYSFLHIIEYILDSRYSTSSHEGVRGRGGERDQDK